MANMLKSRDDSGTTVLMAAAESGNKETFYLVLLLVTRVAHSDGETKVKKVSQNHTLRGVFLVLHATSGCDTCVVCATAQAIHSLCVALYLSFWQGVSCADCLFFYGGVSDARAKILSRNMLLRAEVHRNTTRDRRGV